MAKYPVCPRCHSKWVSSFNNLWNGCSNKCGMHIWIDKVGDSLHLNIDNYVIHWEEVLPDRSLIVPVFNPSQQINVPNLPFDISEEKLKLILLFS